MALLFFLENLSQCRSEEARAPALVITPAAETCQCVGVIIAIAADDLTVFTVTVTVMDDRMLCPRRLSDGDD